MSYLALLHKTAHAGLCPRERALAVFFCALLSIYISAVCALLYFTYTDAALFPAFAVLAVLTPVVYVLFTYFVARFGGAFISRKKTRGKLPKRLFAVVFLSLFTVFYTHFIANYPGGINFDNADQWSQVLSGQFDTWHPPLHTMIISLVTYPSRSYPFFIGVQITAFCLAAAYMAATLSAWGIHTRWIIAMLIIIISPANTADLLLYALKDSLLTILFMLAAVCMINISFSGGEWLNKKSCAAALALIGAFALIRHNGFFFTLPLAVLLISTYRKTSRGALYACILSICAILIITRVVYPLTGVTERPNQTYIELVGLPMTILSGVMANAPEKADAEAREFMLSFGSEDDYRRFYYSDIGFNSVKGYSTLNIVGTFIDHAPAPNDFARMVMRTIKNAPEESARQAAILTRIVYGPFDARHNVGIVTVPNLNVTVYDEKRAAEIKEKTAWVAAVNTRLRDTISFLTPDKLLSSIGLYVFALFFFGVYSLSRNLKKQALFLFLPPLAYNFGTMLLLAGPEYRFFHFNPVITAPLIIALLAKPSEAR